MSHKKMYVIRLAHLLTIVALSLLSGRSYAVNTFTDPGGRFVIDLPDDWELQTQTDKDAFVFKGDDKSIIMEYIPHMKDRDELFEKGVSSLRSSGLPNAAPKEQIKDLTVNDNPARWGLYADKIKYGSIEVELNALVGSVSLNDGGVYFLSILSKNAMKSLRGTLETSFQSIRTMEQPLTGAGKAKAATGESASDTPKTFEHKYLSLTLPAGWSTQAIPGNFEKEVIAWLKSGTIAGASITVSCYRGFRYNTGKIRIGGLKTIAAAYPKGQKMIKDRTKLKTDSGGSAVFELWQGVVDIDGQMMSMQSPMGIVKTKHCWLLMIGYAPGSAGPQLEKDFIKIIKSAK